jgi:hypothetical protein
MIGSIDPQENLRRKLKMYLSRKIVAKGMCPFAGMEEQHTSVEFISPDTFVILFFA